MEIKNKEKIISGLHTALKSATEKVIKEGRPLVISKNDTLVGKYLVSKDSNAQYSIKIRSNNSLVYNDINLYESAVLVAQNCNSGNSVNAKEIIKLDGEYAKYKIDMMHYLHCYKKVKDVNDIDRMLVLEDKFNMAEELSKSAKHKLTRFKISR